jgi:hypothetical protein
MTMKKFILLMVILTSVFFAQNEIVINTTKIYSQRDPQTARDLLGNFIVVWDSENPNSQSDIFLQQFNSEYEKIGGEVQVNTITENEQERPSVAMNSNGDFVVVWASHSNDMNSVFDIKARIFKNNVPAGDEFLVNTSMQFSQTKPQVAMNNSGEFVIVWESWTENSDREIFMQRFDANGNKSGNEIRVNKTTAYSQARPDVAFLDNGNFVISWESWKQIATTSRGYDLFASIYDSNGNLLVEELQVNTYTNDYQWYSNIEPLENGQFIIAWCSWEQDGYDGGIYLQKFDSFGNKIGDEKIVNSSLVNYQWLPKVHKLSNGNIAVVWSSWKQDGDREGVYCQILDNDLNKLSFETMVNEYTSSYQWEPDFIVTDSDELFVVWSSWGQFGKENDFDIIGRLISPVKSQVVINSKTLNHKNGNSTGRIFVHVVDSTAVTGDVYEVTFAKPTASETYANIYNKTKSTNAVSGFSLNGGEGVFYISPVFDGIAVQFNPAFEFKLDIEHSYFINNSNSNFQFTIGTGAGVKVLAPIDAVVIWGSTDTLSDGTFSSPSDMAYNSSGQKVVKCPFIVWNITDNEKMDLVVLESSSTANKNWDVKEEVGILTPKKYTSQFPRYHASFKAIVTGEKKYPTNADSLFILTKRPITEQDTFNFVLSKSYFTTEVKRSKTILKNFCLYQNYPNPFNPSTTISYTIPSSTEYYSVLQNVTLKVYDILGREVATLVNENKPAGMYNVKCIMNNASSGVYFYTLKAGAFTETKKMILLR